MPATVVLLFILLAALLGLKTWYWLDNRAAARCWHDLCALRPGPAGIFEPGLLDGLPEPARRYFGFAIRPGTPLATITELSLEGDLGLGPAERPGYCGMQALQVLAPPYGFVWRARARRGALRFSGTDEIGPETSWSRFWLWSTVPLVRAGGDPDHRRSSFGRLIGEAVFWTPAALLPRVGLRWLAIDDDTARVTVVHGGLTQSVDVTVADDGRPVRIVLPRWTDANPDKVYRHQPFGGCGFDFRDVDGYRVPMRVEAGNQFGTDAYFPFYKARVVGIRYLQPGVRP